MNGTECMNGMNGTECMNDNVLNERWRAEWPNGRGSSRVHRGFIEGVLNAS